MRTAVLGAVQPVKDVASSGPSIARLNSDLHRIDLERGGGVFFHRLDPRRRPAILQHHKRGLSDAGFLGERALGQTSEVIVAAAWRAGSCASA
jgi:hypothetical protein